MAGVKGGALLAGENLFENHAPRLRNQKLQKDKQQASSGCDMEIRMEKRGPFYFEVKKCTSKKKTK
jgi:hypothetical protein